MIKFYGSINKPRLAQKAGLIKSYTGMIHYHVAAYCNRKYPAFGIQTTIPLVELIKLG